MYEHVTSSETKGSAEGPARIVSNRNYHSLNVCLLAIFSCARRETKVTSYSLHEPVLIDFNTGSLRAEALRAGQVRS